MVSAAETLVDGIPMSCSNEFLLLVVTLPSGEHGVEAVRDIPRSATIRTLVPCIFLTLQRQHFQKLLAHSPEVRTAILAQEAERTSAPFAQSQTTAPFAIDTQQKN